MMNRFGAHLAVLAVSLPALAQPTIVSLNGDTFPRSGRVAIVGSGFGAMTPGSRVEVGGLPAWHATWTDQRIVAWVPESAALGSADVQIITASGKSNKVNLTVVARQSDGRVKWTFEADTDNLWFRPALAPDGTIYLNSSEGFIYALSPDGGLKWTAKALWFPYAPPTAGADGTLYVGSISTVTAFTPSGQIAWEFKDGGALGVEIVPTMGPDGNLYGMFNPGNPGLGAFSLTPNGSLRWSNPGNPFILEYGGSGAEMRFGPSRAGGPVDQIYVGADRRGDNYLYAFSLDGQRRWAIPVGPNAEGAEPVIGSDGTIYSTDFGASGYGWVIRAFEPNDGSPIWLYDGDFISGISHLDRGSQDQLYYVADLGRLEALSPNGPTLLWKRVTGEVLGRPTVSPDGKLIVCSGTQTYGMPGFVRAFDADTGADVWSLPLPGAVYPAKRILGTDRPRFAPDSTTVYVSTVTLSGGSADPSSYLYAIDTGLTGGRDCDAIQKLKAGCKKGTLAAKVTSSLPGGTELTVLRNGSDAKILTLGNGGKGRVSWQGVIGLQRVSIAECPEVKCRDVACD